MTDVTNAMIFDGYKSLNNKMDDILFRLAKLESFIENDEETNEDIINEIKTALIESCLDAEYSSHDFFVLLRKIYIEYEMKLDR